MTEGWRAVEGYDGYEVSDLGRVRCSRAQGFAAKPSEPRQVKPKGAGSNRYLSVNLGFKGPTREIHRMVGEMFVPGQAPGLEVAHDNGNKHDNRASNLVWKTRKDNHQDKLRHGTHGRTLTADTVQAVRDAFVPGVTTYGDLAEQFGITPSYVGKIIRRQSWSHAA